MSLSDDGVQTVLQNCFNFCSEVRFARLDIDSDKILAVASLFLGLQEILFFFANFPFVATIFMVYSWQLGSWPCPSTVWGEQGGG